MECTKCSKTVIKNFAFCPYCWTKVNAGSEEKEKVENDSVKVVDLILKAKKLKLTFILTMLFCAYFVYLSIKMLLNDSATIFYFNWVIVFIFYYFLTTRKRLQEIKKEALLAKRTFTGFLSLSAYILILHGVFYLVLGFILIYFFVGDLTFESIDDYQSLFFTIGLLLIGSSLLYYVTKTMKILRAADGLAVE